VNKIKLLKSKLNLVYKNKNKKQPQDLFSRKTTEADTLPGYSDVQSVIKLVEVDVPVNLNEFEELFGSKLDIDVSSEAGAPARQRMVSHLT